MPDNVPTSVYELYPDSSPTAVCVWPSDTEEERQKLAGAINHWVRVQERSKWEFAREWFENMAFLSGNPFTRFEYDGTSMQEIRPQNRESLLPREVCNYLKPAFEQNVAMFTSVKPMPRVSPRSDRPEDRAASEIGAVIIKVLWEDPLRMPEKIRHISEAQQYTGTVAAEIVFRKDDRPVSANEAEEKETEAPPKPTSVFEGFLCNVFDGFHLLPDPGATDDWDSLSWLGVSTFQDRGEVQEAYGRNEPYYFTEGLDKMTMGTDMAEPLYWRARLKDILNYPQARYSFVASSTQSNEYLNPNTVVVRQLDVKPNAHFPQGRTLVVAGEQLVYAGPSRAWSEKYPKRWTPLVLFRYSNRPGSFWGTPLLTDLIPMQRVINGIDTHMKIWSEQLCYGQWLVPNVNKVKDGVISAKPYTIIPYTWHPSNVKPERVDNQPLPEALIAKRNIMVEHILKLSGTLTGQGVDPANVRSGIHSGQLRRENLEAKSPSFQSFEEGLERLAQSILIEVQENVEEEDAELTRRLQVAARDHSTLSISAFRGADLRDNTIVEIDIIDEIMTSPEEKKDRATMALQYYGPNMSPRQAEKVMREMGLKEFADDSILHVNKAQHMISLIKVGQLEAGGLVLPGIDDPGIMAEVFQSEMLRPSFYDLPSPVQTAIKETFDRYAEMVAQQQAQQAQIEAAMAAAPKYLPNPAEGPVPPAQG